MNLNNQRAKDKYNHHSNQRIFGNSLFEMILIYAIRLLEHFSCFMFFIIQSCGNVAISVFRIWTYVWGCLFEVCLLCCCAESILSMLFDQRFFFVLNGKSSEFKFDAGTKNKRKTVDRIFFLYSSMVLIQCEEFPVDNIKNVQKANSKWNSDIVHSIQFCSYPAALCTFVSKREKKQIILSTHIEREWDIWRHSKCKRINTEFCSASNAKNEEQFITMFCVITVWMWKKTAWNIPG